MFIPLIDSGSETVSLNTKGKRPQKYDFDITQLDHCNIRGKEIKDRFVQLSIYGPRDSWSRWTFYSWQIHDLIVGIEEVLDFSYKESFVTDRRGSIFFQKGVHDCFIAKECRILEEYGTCEVGVKFSPTGPHFLSFKFRKNRGGYYHLQKVSEEDLKNFSLALQKVVTSF